MKRAGMWLGAAAIAWLAVAPAARAQDEQKTVTGEVIDVACNQGKGHEDCATSCASRGEPVGILAKDGLYVITGKYTDNKNEKLIAFVAKNVEAKGVVKTDKDGRKTIDLSAIALAK